MTNITSHPFARHAVLNTRNRVLIVDDHAVLRRALRKEFERAGWEVCGEATNGREALEKTGGLRPQVVILDLAMPEMNGLTAARLLKREFPEIHLILFTGHGEIVRPEEAISAGISTVCSKSEPIFALLEKAQTLVTKPAFLH